MRHRLRSCRRQPSSTSLVGSALRQTRQRQAPPRARRPLSPLEVTMWFPSRPAVHLQPWQRLGDGVGARVQPSILVPASAFKHCDSAVRLYRTRRHVMTDVAQFSIR
eukprot:855691-Prymnesium_polylepis.1